MKIKDPFEGMPTSVMFVKMMGAIGSPIGLESYERALKEGPEYFPEEKEYRRKWALIPQHVKDAYFKESPGLFWGSDDFETPDEVKNWPGIAGATEHDWKVWNEYHSSDAYKRKMDAREQNEKDTYNKYFAEYGLTK